MKTSTITDVEQLPLVLNSEQFAKLLGVNVKTLAQFLRDNPGCPHFRIGNRGLIKAPRDAVMTWIENLSKSHQDQTA